MPVAGPRHQRGPDPGYRNPEHQDPTMFNRWLNPHPVMVAGRSPGTMVVCLNGFVLAAGQIRRLYKQKINQIVPAGPYNQVTLSPTPSNPSNHRQPIEVTRGWRYLAGSSYQGAGDNSQHWGGHTVVSQTQVKPTVTAGHGGRNRPTVRNRLTSFGSRVPTLNGVVDGASGGASS
jgi:hypothetical protein